MLAREVTLLKAKTSGLFTGRIGLHLIVLAVWALVSLPLVAQADELDTVQAELGDKTAELQEITDRINASGDELAALDKEIDGLLDDIAERQELRGELQQQIFAISKVMYKNGAQLNLASIVTNAESLSDVLDRMEMRRKVLSEYADLVSEQERVRSELEVSYQKVSAQKDEQSAKLAELRSQQADLDSAVAELQNRADELTAAQKAALEAAEEAERRAAEAAKADNTPAPKPAKDTSDDSKEPDEAKAPEPEPEPEPAAETASGWQTGLASAYGGSSDDTVGDDPTATGTTVDDWSMGVAVPLAWGPEAYYGRSVEISYGGVTVVATVTDCGGMNGGERSLDLQPGVFKAFGFSTCDDWGVREVQYRFL